MNQEDLDLYRIMLEWIEDQFRELNLIPSHRISEPEPEYDVIIPWSDAPCIVLWDYIRYKDLPSDRCFGLRTLSRKR